ncbi:MAG: Ni/Fe-hydrogenase, b-type cytochrome subunit [Gammaproteobacteria bacterium]|nr:Ni/Fe-hydrogenase, b-type cytochrome subunit [Gammaproteobacteria bacterium]MDH4255316.1 Ni/Fe-hydrogenase, b-type cytochrome subunit [Gammaproteobacteria bacterium]MDH5273113.1 Ni/Fe-hydrogenase, b-type cytochrome subunit [Gammaproteobacteria bacterium]
MSVTASSVKQETIYVYEAPLRLWHWVNGLAIVVLALTGYFIGQPLPTMSGEASDHYLMGYIRFTHFTAAYVLIVGFLFRIYWAFVGNRHARQIFAPPLLSGRWWREVWHEMKWYSFVEREPKKYLGHNPLATLAMHFILVWGTVFMIVTGLALYGEGEGMGSWQYRWFSSWVIPLLGNSQDTHMIHRLGMWYVLCFVIIHCYVAIREDIMSRQSIVSTMISGFRMFKDNRPSDG